MMQTVVVVDDDPVLLELLEMLVTSLGDVVFPCAHASDAVELIRQVLPDVVLLDLQAPGDRRAGLTVLAQLRAHQITASIPVILMSADHEALFRHKAHLSALGATPLRKPFEPARLCQMIEHAG